MESIFISYRRGDSGPSSGRIYETLERYFGRGAVFKDVDSIPIGASFPDHLRSVLERCGVVLVVIGPHWLTAADEQGRRRLDFASDFVRQEVEMALANASTKLVIPLLVDGAAMPARSDLPPSLQPLASLNATQVRGDPDYHTDMARLIRIVEQYLISRSAQTGQASVPAKYQPEDVYRSTRRIVLIVAGAVTVLVVVLAVVLVKMVPAILQHP